MSCRRAVAFAAALLVVSAPLFAEGAPRRVRLEGETLDALALEISFDGVDFADAASVVRAKAEIDTVLEARLETQFALVLVNEMATAYRGLVDPAVLERELNRDDLAGARRRSKQYAAAEIAVTLGKPESRAADRALYPVIVVARAEGKEIEKRSFRMDVARSPEGRWLVLRAEYLCLDCQGRGKTEEKACGTCAGLGWIDKPLVGLPEAVNAPDGESAVAARDDAKALAAGFLRARAAVSRRVLAGFATRIGRPYREYCARFVAPAALKGMAGDGASPFSGEISYEPGEIQPAEDSFFVPVRERLQSTGGKPVVTPLLVHLVRTAEGLRVESFGVPCRACAGTGACSLCQGTGLVKDKPCTGCEGSQTCMACQGKRVVLAEPFTPRF